jgi:hypothetical protein
MARTYGKTPKRKNTTKTRKPTGEAVKYRIRTKGDLPMNLPQVQQGFYELLHAMRPYAELRVARLDVYVRYVDDQARPVGIGETEISIYPYVSTADENGI